MSNFPSSSSIDTLAIVGVGLIGGSFAAALRKAGRVKRVLGVGRRPGPLVQAKQLGLITKVINVTRWSDVLAFAEGGVQLISGPVLVTPSRKLLPPKRLTIAEVRNRVNEDTSMDDMARIKSSVG